MQVTLFIVIGMVIFQGILLLTSGVFVIVDDVNNGFFRLVDVTSKIATISVFVWAMHTYIEQRKTKRSDDKYLRLKDLSNRLIDYVSTENFIFNNNVASILIAYLEAIKEETETETEMITSSHLKEYKLSLAVTYEVLKKITLKEVLDINEENNYIKIVKKIKSIYSDYEQLVKFDYDFSVRLNSPHKKTTSMKINVPSYGVQLWQIKKIMSLVLECDEDLVEKELSRGFNSTSGRHHQFPVLYAIYYVYENGVIHVSNGGQISFFINEMEEL